MSISVFYITNVLRTYNHVLKLDPTPPAEDSSPEGFKEDILDISDEGKQRLNESLAQSKSSQVEGKSAR